MRDREEQKIIAVDLDGTLIKPLPAKYYKDNPQYITDIPVYGKVNKRLKNIINKLYWENDYKIIVYTARHWKDYGYIREWLDNNCVEFTEVICGKFDFDILIDDRTVSPSVTLKEVLKKLEEVR